LWGRGGTRGYRTREKKGWRKGGETNYGGKGPTAKKVGQKQQRRGTPKRKKRTTAGQGDLVWTAAGAFWGRAGGKDKWGGINKKCPPYKPAAKINREPVFFSRKGRSWRDKLKKVAKKTQNEERGEWP